MCIEKIIDFKYYKIFDVLTYTAITILNKKKNTRILYDHILPNQSLTEYLNNINFSAVPIESLNNQKWRLLKQKDQESIKIIESQPFKL